MIASAVIIFPGSGAENNAWLAVIIGLLEGLAFLYIYFALAKLFPQLTLVEINDAVFGKYLGKLISCFYLLLALWITAQLLRMFGEFFNIIMPETPIQAFLISLLFITVWVVRNGLEPIARCSQILVPLTMVLIVLDFLLILNKIDLSNLLPFMDIAFNQFFMASQSIAALPCGEMVFFLMFFHAVNNQAQIKPAILRGYMIAGLILLFLAFRAITVLGPLALITTYPSLSVARVINIADIITRLDIIVAVNFLCVGFIKGILMMYALVLGTAQLVNLGSYRPLVLPLAALIFVVSLLLYDSYIYDLIDAALLFPVYSLPITVLLPLLTLILARLKNSGKETANAG